MSRNRRAFLATGLAALTSLAGCSGGGGGNADPRNEEEPEELITKNKETKVKTPDGIHGRIRSVTHEPEESRASIAAEVNVPEDGRYKLRLAVIDQRVVVLGEENREPELSGTGTNLETAELRVDDCEACFSGLLEVDYTDREVQQPAPGSANARASENNNESLNGSESGNESGAEGGSTD